MESVFLILADARRAQQSDDLLAPQDKAVRLAEIDHALGLLKLCVRYGLQPTSTVTVLPRQGTETPSSEYRVFEDHESDNPSCWTEVEANGVPVRVHGGDLLVTL
jgi:hypothetical protein